MLATTVEAIVEIDIARPRADVWPFVTDVERLPEWVDEFEAAHTEPPGATGAGTADAAHLGPLAAPSAPDRR